MRTRLVDLDVVDLELAGDLSEHCGAHGRPPGRSILPRRVKACRTQTSRCSKAWRRRVPFAGSGPIRFPRRTWRRCSGTRAARRRDRTASRSASSCCATDQRHMRRACGAGGGVPRGVGDEACGRRLRRRLGRRHRFAQGAHGERDAAVRRSVRGHAGRRPRVPRALPAADARSTAPTSIPRARTCCSLLAPSATAG